MIDGGESGRERRSVVTSAVGRLTAQAQKKMADLCPGNTTAISTIIRASEKRKGRAAALLNIFTFL